MEDIAKLIKERYTGHDSEGNPITERNAREIFCNVRSVTRSEFYQAAEQDLHPDIVITISNLADYEGEKLIIYGGKIYDVIRSHWQGDEVELTLTERTGEIPELYANLEMPDGRTLMMPDDRLLLIKEGGAWNY